MCTRDLMVPRSFPLKCQPRPAITSFGNLKRDLEDALEHDSSHVRAKKGDVKQDVHRKQRLYLCPVCPLRFKAVLKVMLKPEVVLEKRWRIIAQRANLIRMIVEKGRCRASRVSISTPSQRSLNQAINHSLRLSLSLTAPLHTIDLVITADGARLV